MKLQLSGLIELDLSDISQFIAQSSVKYAQITVEKLRAEVKEIGRHPEHYQLRPDIGPGTRSSTIGSYVILFRITDDIVRIERILHGGRNLSSLLQ
ncbi:MAG: type II toxin-antitoxin system RelE/ParE family toxin [Acidobacteria bacterium]|nr:type II toxin-antitoxin system RelE/ParE family toxin [Acidobacteriota bacterium]